MTSAILTPANESSIAHDLARCDVMLAIGSRAMKRAAKAHRAACFKALREANKAEGLSTSQTAKELLEELGA